MTEIILVRHGQTAWNLGEVFRGRADVPLDETGRKQAELLAGYLDSRKLVAALSSPLVRALETAEAVAVRHGLKVEVSPGLTDIDFGEWQGLSRAEVKDRYSNAYATWRNHPDQVTIPAGESLAEVRQRAMAVVTDLVSGAEGAAVVGDDRAILIATHRVVLKLLACAMLGLDDSHFWSFRLDTAGTTVFSHHDGRFVLNSCNVTAYLEPLGGDRLADF